MTASGQRATPVGDVRLSHVSLTARDADALAAFYRAVFGLSDRRPPRRLSGDMVSRGNGLPGSDIYVIWLSLPDASGPFLEIMQHHETVQRPRAVVNELGFGHIAMTVPDLKGTVEAVLRFGGTMQGAVTNFGTDEAPHLIVYVRDPEGNILEIEQPAAG